jgi:Cdc6-like AAA superfamily ATPase
MREPNPDCDCPGCVLYRELVNIVDMRSEYVRRSAFTSNLAVELLSDLTSADQRGAHFDARYAPASPRMQ